MGCSERSARGRWKSSFKYLPRRHRVRVISSSTLQHFANPGDSPEYITIAFKAAESEDADVKLYYNDYNIDNDWSVAPPVPSGSVFRYHHIQHRNAHYGHACRNTIVTNKIEGAKCLINMVREQGGKVDGIGLQGHYVYNSTPSADKLANIMDGFAELDLDIAITELDIRMDFANINEATAAKQAQGYADVLTACRDTERCVGITLWDFTDKYSWVTTVLERFGSAHPWDSNLVLKQQVWDAMMRGWGAAASC